MVATILSESISVYNTELLLLYCFTTFLLLIFGIEPIIEQAAASKCYSFFFQSRLNNFLSTISDKPFDTKNYSVWIGWFRRERSCVTFSCLVWRDRKKLPNFVDSIIWEIFLRLPLLVMISGASLLFLENNILKH